MMLIHSIIIVEVTVPPPQNTLYVKPILIVFMVDASLEGQSPPIKIDVDSSRIGKTMRHSCTNDKSLLHLFEFLLYRLKSFSYPLHSPDKTWPWIIF